MTFYQIKEKIGFQWLFCLIMIIVFGLVFLFNPNIGNQSWQYFIDLIKRIAPLLLIVFVLLFILNLFLQPKTVIKYLGGKSGPKGWLIAIIGGIISSGPIYLWYPLLVDLKQMGTRNSLIAVFLYSRAIKIPFMPILVFYFGWTFAIVLTVYLIIFSIINGLVVEKFLHNSSHKSTNSVIRHR